MGKNKSEFSVQSFQQRFPWIMWPAAWLDAALTPRRWAYALDRVATAVSNLLIGDSTRPARFLNRLFHAFSDLRERMLEGSPFLMRLDWRVRKFTWSLMWASVVVLHLWPRKTPIPREEKTIRLIPAPASYSDFQSQALVVPSDVPRAEMTLMGAR